MDVVKDLMDVLGLPSQRPGNKKEIRNRRRRTRYEDESSGDEEDDIEPRYQTRTKRDRDKTKRMRDRKPNRDDKASADDLFDTIFGSCSDFGEYYKDQYGNLKNCEGKGAYCHSAPSTRNTSRPRTNSRPRSQQNNSSKDRSRPRNKSENHGDELLPFSVGVGTEIPVGFNNDDMSAVTGVTLEEMAYRAQRQARQSNKKKLIQAKMERENGETYSAAHKHHKDVYTTEVSRNIPPSPTDTSTSSNVKDTEEYDQYDTTSLSYRKMDEQDITHYNEGKSILTTASSTTTEFESIWKSEALPQARTHPRNSFVPKEWEQTNSNIQHLETKLSSKYRLPPPRGWNPRHTRLASI